MSKATMHTHTHAQVSIKIHRGETCNAKNDPTYPKDDRKGERRKRQPLGQTQNQDGGLESNRLKAPVNVAGEAL